MFKKIALLVTGLTVGTTATAQSSELVTSATDGLTAAVSDGLTVGAGLITLAASLIVIGVIWSIVKRGKGAG